MTSTWHAVPVLVAVCVAVPVLAGCRVGGDDTVALSRVATVKCGDIRWGRVDEEQTLIAVSRVVEVSEDDGEVRLSPVRVRELKPQVETSGDGPSAKQVFAALDKRIGGILVARLGKSSTTREHDDVGDFLGASRRFVTAWAVRAVEGTFTADCDGTTVYGSVSTWYGSSRAALKCGLDPSTEGGFEKWVTEAYGLACGAES